MELDKYLRGESNLSLDEILEWKPGLRDHPQKAFLGYRSGFTAFVLPHPKVRKDVLLPKYYDPTFEKLSPRYSMRCSLVSMAELAEAGTLTMKTGDEIGKLSYGSGDIPFVRTSDFGSWELLDKAKQGVSQEVFDEWSKKQEAVAGDILLVRDGTYLVGNGVLLCEADLPLLYCGGLYRIRSNASGKLDSGLLFTMLNLPMVRRQMRNCSLLVMSSIRLETD